MLTWESGYAPRTQPRALLYVLGAVFYLALAAATAQAQVEPVIQVRGGYAATLVANPNAVDSVRVVLQLMHATTDSTGAVVLGEPITTALITPNSFVLQPQAQQVVRMLADGLPTAPGAVRLQIAFEPILPASVRTAREGVVAKLYTRVVFVTKVQVTP